MPIDPRDAAIAAAFRRVATPHMETLNHPFYESAERAAARAALEAVAGMLSDYIVTINATNKGELFGLHNVACAALHRR